MKVIFYFLYASTLAFICSANSSVMLPEECPIQGISPGNNNYYARFLIEGKIFSLPVNDNMLNRLPFEKIERLPLSYAAYNGGYFWQGYKREVGFGIFFHSDKEDSDSVIAKGMFINIFKSNKFMYVIENKQIVNGKGSLKSAVLYELDGSSRKLAEIKKFSGNIARVLSRESVIYGNYVLSDDVYYLIGENGWAYKLADQKGSKYLNCASYQ